MKSFYLNILIQVIRMLISTVNWELIKETVMELTESELTGEQKRAVVLTRLSVLKTEIGTSLLNLALEIAVQKTKAKV
jgi:hypothetical protein